MLYFSIQNMLVVGVKRNLGCEAGCGLTVSWSDHARIMVGSCSDHSRIGRALDMTFHLFSLFTKFLSHFGRLFCVAGAVFGEFGK